MGTLVMQKESPSRSKWLLLLVALAMAGAMWMTLEHAVKRHGANAVEVDRICRETGGFARLTNLETGRKLVVCDYGPKRVGVAIYEADNELVTAFIARAKSAFDYVAKLLVTGKYLP